MSRRGPSGGLWAASVIVGWAGFALNPVFARADGERAAPAWLAWGAGDGREGCSSPRGFADKVEQRLGASADEAARRQGVTLAVELGRIPGGLRGWRAELQVSRAADGSPIGSRSIDQEGGSCESVEDVASFFATLVLSGAPAPLDGAGASGTAPPASPSASAASGPPSPPPFSSSGGPPTGRTPPPEQPLLSPPPPTAAGTSAAVVTVSAAAAPPRWATAVEAGPIVGVGLLPGVSYGAQASVSLGRPAGLRARLGLALWPTRRSQTDGTVGADVSLFMVNLGLCPVSARGTGRVLRGCAGVDVGRLSANGVGLDVSTAQTQAIFDLSAGARLEQVIVGPFFAALEARAEVPLLRVRVGYTDFAGQVHELFRMPPVAAVGQLQLGWLFSP